MTDTRPATNSSADPDPWAADGSTAAFAVRAVVLLAVGGFLGGVLGLGVAGLGVVATWRRPTALVAGAAAASLLAAALATIFEVVPQPGSLRSNFADVRPVASALGLTAGMLAIVAVTTMAVRERAPRPAAPPQPTGRDPWDPAQPTGLAGLRARAAAPAWREGLRLLAPFVAVTFLVVIVRVVLPPAALPSPLHQLIGNLRGGSGYVLGTPGRYRATGAWSPLPALVGAFAPGGATLALLVASVAAVGLALVLANLLAGPRIAAVAALVVLVLQVATGQQLPSTLAAALLLAAMVLGTEIEGPTGRAALAGVALGLAVLSLPWAVLGAPLLVGWISFGRSRAHPGRVGGATMALAAAVLTTVPWLRYVSGRFHTFAPSTDMAFGLATAAAFLPLLVVAGTGLVAARRHPAQD